MQRRQESIVVEIEKELLKKVKNVASARGITTEALLSEIMTQYAENSRLPTRQGTGSKILLRE